MFRPLLLHPGFGAVGELHTRLNAFQGFLLCYLFCRDGLYWSIYQRPIYAINLALLAVACGLFWLRGQRAASMLIALGCVSAKVVLTFPTCSNHLFLEFFVVSFFYLLHRTEDEQKAFVAACRWLVIFVMGFSGLQKLAYTTYFDGSFLASQISTERFGSFLGIVLPADEIARLRSANTSQPPGPFFFSSMVGLLMSNAVWILEIAVGALLLIPKAQRVAVVGAVISLAGIELAAREFMFGIFATNLLMFFAPASIARVIGIVSGVLCAALVSGQFFFPGEMRWFN
jgi:hypothetical protein